MAAIIIQNNDDDQQSLLNKPIPSESNNNATNSKQSSKHKQTFTRWLFSDPWSKLPFIYFMIAFFAVPALAIFHLMDRNTSFIICGGFLPLNVYALKHFYTLIGLKQQVDRFGTNNKLLSIENRELQIEVNRINSANLTLRNTSNRIQAANAQNRENIYEFTKIQETMKELNVESVQELTSILEKAKGIEDSWKNTLIDQERDMLHTVFDRFEKANGKSGMTKHEFIQFSEQLPRSYKNRFARLGTFEHLSTDGKCIQFSVFNAALDLFAEMDALDCDISFSIEKSVSGNMALPPDTDLLPQSTLEVIPSTDEWDENVSEMKRWKSIRKRYDNVERKIVVKSRHFCTQKSKDFTSALGFVVNDDGNDISDDDFDENAGYFAAQPIRSQYILSQGTHRINNDSKIDLIDFDDLISAQKENEDV